MSSNDKVTPKIGTLHYNCHFEMLTPINLGSKFFHFGGGGGGGIAQESHGSSSCLAVELNDGVPSMHSPYDNKGR